MTAGRLRGIVHILKWRDVQNGRPGVRPAHDLRNILQAMWTVHDFYGIKKENGLPGCRVLLL